MSLFVLLNHQLTEKLCSAGVIVGVKFVGSVNIGILHLGWLGLLPSLVHSMRSSLHAL